MTAEHIVLDIETKDTKNSAVVLSIGAVLVDLNHHNPGMFADTFYAVLEMESQEAKGRTTSKSTMEWWAKQCDASRFAALETTTREDTHAVLDRLFDWMALGDFKVWGNGSDFDNAIIADLFQMYGFEVPWVFWNNRCFRTYKAEFGHLVGKTYHTGLKHHALDDASHEAHHLQLIYQALKTKGVTK
jgi:hypothetical protein